MKRRLPLIYLILLTCFSIMGLAFLVFSGGKIARVNDVQAVSYNRSTFIKMIAPDIQKAAKSYGIKPSLIIAKAVVDSQDGKTLLSRKYHNLFNVKSVQREPSVILINSDKTKENYKIYKSWRYSIYDYFDQIKTQKIGNKKFYALLISQKNNNHMAALLESQNGDGSNRYAQKLLTVIEDNNLESYDK